METFFKSLFIFALYVIVFAQADDSRLYILHTNNTNGALENCYCPDHPYGAIEKRSVFINNFITNHPNTIVLDAGDFLSVTKRPYLDSLVLKAYASLPYDAVLAGDQEFYRENIDQLNQKIGIPVLAGNLENGKLHKMSKHLIIDRGGYKIAIAGIIHSSILKYYSEDIRKKYSFTDPVEFTQAFVDQYSDSADVVIALTHEGHDKDRLLAKEVNGIDIIVGSHSQSALDSGDVVNNCLIVQAGKEGYYVGVVELVFDDEKALVSASSYLETLTLDMSDDPYIMELISSLEKKTGHINRNKLKQQEQ